MKKIALAGVALAALASIPAFAQPVADGPARIAQPMTRASFQARVQARFARIDADRDGFVTQQEIQDRRAAGREQHQARRGERREALFARLDANRDGVLSRAEFDAPRAGLSEGRPGQRGQRFGRRGGRQSGMGMAGGFGGRAFASADVDRDGRVSLQEAQAGALRLFDRVDANRDGTVTPEERRAARGAFRAQPRG
jgi:hypothetical protein